MKHPALAEQHLRSQFHRTKPQAVPGAYYLALHVGLPADDQAELEAAYPGYKRLELPTDAATWTVETMAALAGDDGDVVPVRASCALALRFPLSAGEPAVDISHWSIGLAASGSSDILYRGRFEEAFTVGPNHRPEFDPGAIFIEEI